MAGAIIKLTGDQFLKKFIKEQNVDNFEYLLISQDIQTSGKFKNVMKLSNLIPTSDVIQYRLDKQKKQYKKECFKFYREPHVRSFITIIAISALKKNMNIVLLCSEDEAKEYGYNDMLCEYIEKEYKGIKTYDYKSYLKALENKTDFKPDNSKKILEQLDQEIKEINKQNKKDDKKKKEKIKNLMTNLKKYEKKDLKKICKSKEWKGWKELDSKKDLIKFIEKKFTSELES